MLFRSFFKYNIPKTTVEINNAKIIIRHKIIIVITAHSGKKDDVCEQFKFDGDVEFEFNGDDGDNGDGKIIDNGGHVFKIEF